MESISRAPDVPGGYLTMRLAAEALNQRFQLLVGRGTDECADHYAERLRLVTDMIDQADPDDVFEQNAFRESCTAELNQLPLPTGP